MKFRLVLFITFVALSLQAAPIDTIRVSNLTAKPVTSKTFSGAEANKVLSAFDALPWDRAHGKKCFTPAFRLQGLSGDNLVLVASICFGCEWVQFSQPQQKGRQAFDASAASAQQFQGMLKAMFANP